NTSQREGAAKQSPQNLSVFLRASPSSFLRKEPTLRASLPALTVIPNEVKNLGTSRVSDICY
ncbi:hypothetical protein, partial [Dialister succinatiphilus]|uniref:hypothetical protein n=1 Tax=Dialister succinatiphilus TaxID=487173 RepID=UPI003F7E5013